jgi:hypothetical protein
LVSAYSRGRVTAALTTVKSSVMSDLDTCNERVL